MKIDFGERFSKLAFLKAGVGLFIITSLTGGLNYVSQILLSRNLSVEEFGLINFLFSIILIANVPGSSLVTLLSLHASSLLELEASSGVGDAIKQIIGTLIAGFFFTLLLIFTYYSVGPGDVQEDELVISIFVAGIIFLNLIAFSLIGISSGYRKFLLIGLVGLINPIFKILGVFSGTFLDVGNTRLIIVIGAMFLASLMVCPILIIKLKSYGIPIKWSGYDFRNWKFHVSPFHVRCILLNFVLVLLLNVDILILKFKFDSRLVGIYSASLLFGRVIFYLAASLTIVLVPTVAAAKSEIRSQQSFLKLSLFLTTFLSVLFLFPINIWPGYLVLKIFGMNFAESIQYLPVACFISVLFSLNTIIVNYAISITNIAFALASFSVAGLIIGCLAMSNLKSPIQLLNLIAVAAALLVICNCIFYLRTTSQKGTFHEI